MSIDPGLIRAEPHTEVGLLIQRDAEILIQRWVRRAVEEQPNARRTHHQALLDHMHEFLRALGQSLAESGDADISHHCLTATTHGEQRWETGWWLPEVVRGYQILRLVILDYLEDVLEGSPGHRAVLAVGLALDEAIAASVSMYVASRDDSTSSNCRRSAPRATGKFRSTCANRPKPCAKWTAGKASLWQLWDTKCAILLRRFRKQFGFWRCARRRTQRWCKSATSFSGKSSN